MKTSTRTLLACALNVLVMASLACTFSLFELPTLPSGPTLPPFPVVPSPTPQPRAQTTFVVALPEPLAPGEALALAILDEVTGLALNATLYPMTARDPSNRLSSIATSAARTCR